VKFARGPAAWARRALLVAVLVAAAVIPGRASSQQSPHCTGLHCTAAGSILWTHALPGSWLVQSGVSGTATASDGAYAAIGGGVVVVGNGTAVTAYQARTGKWLWHVGLSGIPASSSIVSVRAFAGVVAVGVEPPAGQAGAARDEVILSAATGRQLRIYPAAAYGGAIEADSTRTVIVGDSSVVAYANDSGQVLWHRATGPGAPPWRVAGHYLYVAAVGGRIAAPDVPSVLRINLLTGQQQTVRARSGGFAGSLSGVIDTATPGEPSHPILLFSGPDGVTAYGLDGQQVGPRRPGVLELADAQDGVVYLASGSALTGIDALTGAVVTTAVASVAASLYWVSNGVALGLDQNALGVAWGYSLSARRVVWTSTALPWPHFFVDPSGLGGSATATSDMVVVATCAQVGTAAVAGDAPPCARPQLAAVLIRSR
jgi:hypothetical protein